MQNSGKNRENSGKVGKIRENSGKSGKFGKIRENSGKFGKKRGRTGEEPGNRKFRQKTENFAKKNRGRTGEWGKTCRNAILSNFDVESGNFSVSAQFFVALARFCCFCAFFGAVLLFLCLFWRVFAVGVPFLCCFVEFSRFWGSFTDFRKFGTKMQTETQNSCCRLSGIQNSQCFQSALNFKAAKKTPYLGRNFAPFLALKLVKNL